MALERPEIDPPEGDIPFELGIDDLVVGDGAEATSGSKVTVHYVGVSFLDRRGVRRVVEPRASRSSFKLGAGQVIRRAGTRASPGCASAADAGLTIPSAMAYGARGAGGVIKPHEPLVFVVDLLAVD